MKPTGEGEAPELRTQGVLPGVFVELVDILRVARVLTQDEAAAVLRLVALAPLEVRGDIPERSWGAVRSEERQVTVQGVTALARHLKKALTVLEDLKREIAPLPLKSLERLGITADVLAQLSRQGLSLQEGVARGLVPLPAGLKPERFPVYLVWLQGEEDREWAAIDWTDRTHPDVRWVDLGRDEGCSCEEIVALGLEHPIGSAEEREADRAERSRSLAERLVRIEGDEERGYRVSIAHDALARAERTVGSRAEAESDRRSTVEALALALADADRERAVEDEEHDREEGSTGPTAESCVESVSSTPTGGLASEIEALDALAEGPT